jgi:hypothetical protein
VWQGLLCPGVFLLLLLLLQQQLHVVWLHGVLPGDVHVEAL